MFPRILDDGIFDLSDQVLATCRSVISGGQLEDAAVALRLALATLLADLPPSCREDAYDDLREMADWMATRPAEGLPAQP